MMRSPVPLLLVVMSIALAAPASPRLYDDYAIAIPQKKAALVLDRLLIAIQKALRDGSPRSSQEESEGPRTEPLRIGDENMNVAGADAWSGADSEDLRVAPLSPHFDDMSGLQRRGQAGGAQGVRGRVLRCYFNAVTCF